MLAHGKHADLSFTLCSCKAGQAVPSTTSRDSEKLSTTSRDSEKLTEEEKRTRQHDSSWRPGEQLSDAVHSQAQAMRSAIPASVIRLHAAVQLKIEGPVISTAFKQCVCLELLLPRDFTVIPVKDMQQAQSRAQTLSQVYVQSSLSCTNLLADQIQS